MKRFKEPIFVSKAFLPPFEEYTNLVRSLWDNHWITNNGSLHNQLEEEITKYLNVTCSTLFVNGHLALDVAIKSLNLAGEVITTPFTFASTTHTLVMNNLTPVFCDINLSNFTIDADKIEELISEKTSAILPVHVYGQPCDVEKIRGIADRYNLKVIYDAAHVFGVEIDGQGIGNFGDVSMFSMHATKVYHSIEGGLLTYNNLEYKRLFDLYKNFGITSQERVEAVGLNAKMNEFQAAMGLLNLKYVNEEIEKRKQIVGIYRDALKNIEGIYFIPDRENVKSNYAYFPIIIDEIKMGISRDEVYEKLKDYNVFTRKYFYPLVTDYECYQGKYNDSRLKNAKSISKGVLTLPLYGDLNLDYAKSIVTIFTKIVKRIK